MHWWIFCFASRDTILKPTHWHQQIRQYAFFAFCVIFLQFFFLHWSCRMNLLFFSEIFWFIKQRLSRFTWCASFLMHVFIRLARRIHFLQIFTCLLKKSAAGALCLAQPTKKKKKSSVHVDCPNDVLCVRKAADPRSHPATSTPAPLYVNN